MKPYTYLIKHRPTGKVYYGFRSANKQHPHEDLWKDYFTSSPKVKQLIEETGLDSFDVEVRKIFETKEDAVKWETRVLRRCKVLHSNKWLNQNVAGYIIPTEESNKKISEFHSGKPKSENHKKKLSLSQKGKSKNSTAYQSIEYKELMSKLKSGPGNGRYGAEVTEETRKKISEANKGRIPSNKGKPMSEEQKEKIRAAKKANPYKPTEETRAKQALAQTGKKRTEAQRKNMSAAMTGIVKGPMSEEHKLKISLGSKGKSKSAETTAKKAETLKLLAAEGKHHSTAKVTCIHCNTEVTKLVHGRWHGDHCRNRANPATKS